MTIQIDHSSTRKTKLDGPGSLKLRDEVIKMSEGVKYLRAILDYKLT